MLSSVTQWLILKVRDRKECVFGLIELTVSCALLKRILESINNSLVNVNESQSETLCVWGVSERERFTDAIVCFGVFIVGHCLRSFYS